MNGEHQVFAHLNAENAAIYRAILDAVVAAKEAYRLHVRPEELWRELRGGAAAPASLEHLQLSLGQLVDWGNLIATADTSEVRTVEDYYRASFLYQLSRAGEAAEAALAEFHARLADPGELQTAAIGDIAEHLAALVTELDGSRDVAVLHRTIAQLFDRFEGLADQARRFLSSLRRGLDLRAGGVDDFLRYKQHVIGYVERFLGELTASAGLIVERLQAVERAGIDAALIRAAERELSDQLRQDAEARAAVQGRWRRRWCGLVAWFVGGEGRPAQYTELRAHTRSALTGLLQALAGVHDARLQRSDRVADWRPAAPPSRPGPRPRRGAARPTPRAATPSTTCARSPPPACSPGCPRARVPTGDGPSARTPPTPACSNSPAAWPRTSPTWPSTRPAPTASAPA